MHFEGIEGNEERGQEEKGEGAVVLRSKEKKTDVKEEKWGKKMTVRELDREKERRRGASEVLLRDQRKPSFFSFGYVAGRKRRPRKR